MKPKSQSSKWQEYYQAQGKFGFKNKTLIKSLKLCQKINKRKKLQAVDLGCGRGDDTFYLLKSGVKVLAIDAEKYALNFLKSNISGEFKKNLKCKQLRFEKISKNDFPDCNLVNASKSLFFCTPRNLDKIWKKIDSAILPNGLFCGHFLGNRDSWASRPGINAVNRRKLAKMFENYSIIELDEFENDGGTLTGRAKHWHFFTIIAVKK